MKKIQLVVLVFFLSLAFISCKKTSVNEQDNSLISEQTISNLKNWYESQLKQTTNSLIGSKKTLKAQPNWQETKFYTTEETFLTPLDINNSSNTHIFLETKMNSNGQVISGKYIYIFSSLNSKYIITKNTLTLDFLKLKFLPQNFIGSVVEADLQDNLIVSKNIENGIVVNSNKSSIKFINTYKDKKGQTSTSNVDEQDPYGVEIICTYWYWVVFDENGDVVSSTFAYSICTPGGGGGGGNGENGEPLSMEGIFNSYITSNTPSNSYNAPYSISSANSICGTQTWTIVEGAISSWKVIANTQYCYTHDSYYDLTLNANVHSFNFSNYQTGASYFTGSNSLIASTWTETSKTDQILNNNSPQAKGKTQIVGSIRHVLLQSIPIINNLDVTQNVSNGLFLYPG
jgi:hypothetical protein